jgi:hypothetical protein
MVVRRSIVLDVNDQSIQLALALRSQPQLVRIADHDNNDNRIIINVQVCLLHMEEDEASEGIPLVLKTMNDDDEHLITSNDPNFHSSVEVTAKMSSNNSSSNDYAHGNTKHDDERDNTSLPIAENAGSGRCSFFLA